MTSDAVKDPNELSAVEAAKAIAEGRLTSEALVAACLARIEQREGTVRAWAHVDPDAALAAARERDRQPARGPLHGVPVGVKDVIDTADMPTQYNSAIWSGYRPKADAACVAVVRRAGAVILGKTVTAEFAFRAPGPTTNPHNAGHTPGGSSSGSAAAVADFMVPLSFTTQTGGSTIRPAAYCGVVGYKPTYNLINRAGVKPVAESLDTVGVIARTVADAALLAAAAAGQPIPDVTDAPPRLPRIGFCRTSRFDKTDAATRDGLEQVARRLAKAGAEVADVTLPAEAEALFDAHQRIMVHEMAHALAYEYNDHRERMSTWAVEEVEKGLAQEYARYQESQVVAIAARARIDALFGVYDLLLTPSAPGEAPPGLKETGPSLFNRVWTALHVPCVTLPVLQGATGLPVGAQLVGRRHADARTLTLAHWAHQVLA